MLESNDMETYIEQGSSNRRKLLMKDIPVGSHVLVTCTYNTCHEGILKSVDDDGIVIFNTRGTKGLSTHITYKMITSRVLVVETYLDKVLEHRKLIPEDCLCYDPICVVADGIQHIGTIKKLNFDNIVIEVAGKELAIPVTQITEMRKM